MSAKPHGAGAGHCDACGRAYIWGCGHSGSQESRARRHNATRKHQARECECFGHDYCDPTSCALAHIRIAGYTPFEQHTPAGREPLVAVAIRAAGATS
jgi:hypothetical protein